MCGFLRHAKRFMNQRGAEAIYNGIPKALNFLGFPLLLVTAWLAISRVHALWQSQRLLSHNSCTVPEKPTIYTPFFFLLLPVFYFFPSVLTFSCFEARSQNCEKWLLASWSLSVCPHGTARLPIKGFSWNFVFEYFPKICRGNSDFIKIWRE